MMKMEMGLETSRRELATIGTFCIRQFFDILDQRQREKLSLNDFRVLMDFLEIDGSLANYFTPLFTLYDSDKDSMITFKNLIQMISPRDMGYWRMLTSKKSVQISRKVRLQDVKENRKKIILSRSTGAMLKPS